MLFYLQIFGFLCCFSAFFSYQFDESNEDLSTEPGKEYPSNIQGTFAVKIQHHYSNKTSVIWGRNNETSWKVKISLSTSASIYDCSNTSSYYCSDASYMYDWNKLWGKARCGYYHDHHEDSDRFVFRKCSDSSCNGYQDGKSLIQIGAYSYDNGIAPYTTEGSHLLKVFETLIEPEEFYVYELNMDDQGNSTYILRRNDDNSEMERQVIQHSVICSENFYEGTVNGLYFGGTCRAPIEIIAVYDSS